jgi:predicted enzyme related to lactoylglutathione lyase
MTISLAHVTFDCQDASVVSAFWSAAIGRPVDDGASPGIASIGMASESEAPKWLFIQVPEAKTAKNRMHLDLSTDDRDAEVDRLVSLGASKIGDHDEYETRWTVLADPEGNEFCVA